MMKKMIIVFVCFVLMAPVYAKDCFEFFSRDTLEGEEGTGKWLYAHVFDGDYSYYAFNRETGATSCMTKVENSTGTSSVLFSGEDWYEANQQVSTSLNVYYGLGISGDYLLWTDSGTDAVWKADKNTGEITNVVTKAQISEYLGVSLTQSLAYFCVAPNGGLTFYERETDYVLNVTLDGTLSTIMTKDDLDTYAYDSDNFRSGMAYDDQGNLYWANSSSDSIYRLTTNGVIETVLTETEIQAVTGSSSDIYTCDIFYGEDKRIYFSDYRSKIILVFDPAADDLVETLELVMNTGDLSDIDLGTGSSNDFMVSIGWYTDDAGVSYLTFNGYYSGLLATIIDLSADIVKDGVVDLKDFALISQYYSQDASSCPAADINGDEVIDMQDAIFVFEQWTLTVE